MTTFTTIFVTSTLCLLTYVKIKKIEGGIFYDVSMSPRPKKKNQTHYLILFIRAYNGFSKSGLFFKFFWPQIPTILRTFFVDKIVNGNLRAPIALFLTKKWYFVAFIAQNHHFNIRFLFFFQNIQVYRPNLWKKMVFAVKSHLLFDFWHFFFF